MMSMRNGESKALMTVAAAAGSNERASFWVLVTPFTFNHIYWGRVKKRDIGTIAEECEKVYKMHHSFGVRARGVRGCARLGRTV